MLFIILSHIQDKSDEQLYTLWSFIKVYVFLYTFWYSNNEILLTWMEVYEYTLMTWSMDTKFNNFHRLHKIGTNVNDNF